MILEEEIKNMAEAIQDDDSETAHIYADNMLVDALRVLGKKCNATKEVETLLSNYFRVRKEYC